MKFLNFFLLLWNIFALLDPYSEYGSGSTDLIEFGSRSEHCLKQTIVVKRDPFQIAWIRRGSCGCAGGPGLRRSRPPLLPLHGIRTGDDGVRQPRDSHPPTQIRRHLQGGTCFCDYRANALIHDIFKIVNSYYGRFIYVYLSKKDKGWSSIQYNARCHCVKHCFELTTCRPLMDGQLQVYDDQVLMTYLTIFCPLVLAMCWSQFDHSLPICWPLIAPCSGCRR